MMAFHFKGLMIFLVSIICIRNFHSPSTTLIFNRSSSYKYYPPQNFPETFFSKKERTLELGYTNRKKKRAYGDTVRPAYVTGLVRLIWINPNLTSCIFQLYLFL